MSDNSDLKSYSIGEYIAKELEARGWGIRDLLERFPQSPERDSRKDEMAIGALLDRPDHINGLGKWLFPIAFALDVSPEFLSRLESSCKEREGSNA